ncbi:acetyl-coenzyme-A carboxylase, partial [Quaeritorhiza haematococci]
PAQVTGDKPHQRYRQLRRSIDGLLDGYDYLSDTSILTKHLIEILRNPSLPFLQTSEVLSSLSGRIPSKLDTALHAELEKARERGEGFPSAVLQGLVNGALEDAWSVGGEEERTRLVGVLSPIQHILHRYARGSKHHERAVLAELLERYHTVEELFNQTRYEDVLLTLRDRYKSDLHLAVNIALSHSKSALKSEFVLHIMEHVRKESGEEEGELWKEAFMPIIQKLVNLRGRETSKVALRAREFLIYFQLPTWGERYVETLEILNAAVRPALSTTSTTTTTTATPAAAAVAGAATSVAPPSFQYDKVAKLITANHSILDVLPAFFYHENIGIRAIAMYTYVLHTSQAYSINSVKTRTNDDPVVFEWEFVLRPVFKGFSSSGVSPTSPSFSSLSSSPSATSPSSASSPGGQLMRSHRPLGSYSDLTALDYDTKASRRGLMCAFESIEDMENKLERVIRQVTEPASTPTTTTTTRAVVVAHVMNIVLKSDCDPALSGDDTVAKNRLQEVVHRLSPHLRHHNFKRITFMLVRESHFPRYLTFRDNIDYREDPVIRNIEPAMAYQLELQRLQNFEIKPCFIENRRLHVYYAVGKKNPTDIRFFIRAVVFPGQHVTDVFAPQDFLVSEGNRVLAEVLDALEVVNVQHPNTDCNHLFINFVPTFELDLAAIETGLKDLVDRHGKRLWKLRVTNAEIRFITRAAGGGHAQSAKPVRFLISSSTGFVTRAEVYQEARDSMGVNKLLSITSPPGPLHNQPVNSLYPTKESIQPKRYKAHLMGTTYIYDFPELFRRAVEKKWILLKEKEPFARVPNVILNMRELVLDEGGELVEVFREP